MRKKTKTKIMKKFFLTVLTGISLISSSFAADELKVNTRIKNSFTTDFRSAQDVQWRTNNAYVTAAFIMNNKKVEAFYDFSGSLIGTSEAITLDMLPSATKRSFAKKYGSYLVKEAIKFEKPDETAYFISAQNEKETLVLQVIDGQISVFKRV